MGIRRTMMVVLGSLFTMTALLAMEAPGPLVWKSTKDSRTKRVTTPEVSTWTLVPAHQATSQQVSTMRVHLDPRTLCSSCTRYVGQRLFANKGVVGVKVERKTGDVTLQYVSTRVDSRPPGIGKPDQDSPPVSRKLRGQDRVVRTRHGEESRSPDSPLGRLPG
ncbi:MAG: hypothetical protein ACE5JX_04635 [Acidobacteriota bacterium]